MNNFFQNLFILIFIHVFALNTFAQIQEMELEASDNIGLQLKFLSNDKLQSNTIGTIDDGDLIFRSDGLFGETMRILDDNGFIGIGKIDPISRVDILGSATLSSDFLFPSAGTQESRVSRNSSQGGGNIGPVAFQFNGLNGVLSGLRYDGLDTRLFNDEPGSGGGWVVVSANGGPSSNVYLQAQNDLIFQTGLSLNQRMIVNESGNVGIGTSSPSAKLEVAGGIKVGDSMSAVEGTIRFDGTNLQAYIAGQWQNICVGNCAIVDCNLFNVESPAANQTFSQDFQINVFNQVTFNVRFSRPVNPATVVDGSTFVFSSGGITVPGTITWNGSNTIATFTSTDEYTNFCSFTPDCFMELELIGTNAGNGAIEDANGCTLDGDGDGNQGGNYTTTFGILG